MTPRIIKDAIRKDELCEMAKECFGVFAKAVVDIRQGIMAIGGELHADGEQILLEAGSRQEDLWGVNIHPDKPLEQRVEFNSMINIRPSAGNRSRDVEDPAIREKIMTVIHRLVGA